MRLLLRLLAAAVSGLCLLALFAGIGVALLFGTQTGRDLVEEETRSALSRVFGPAYEVTLGNQSFDLRDDGTLAVSWTGVQLQRKDRPGTGSELRRASVALQLMPLVGGTLEFGRLELDGARIDVSAFGEPPERMRPPRPQAEQAAGPEARSAIARTADSAIRTLERQLQTLGAYHFDTVVFQDIVIEGLPERFGKAATATLEHAELRRRFDGSLALSTRLQVGALPLTLNGTAAFDDASGRLQSLALRSGRTELASILPPAPLEDVDDERRFGSDSSVSLEARMERDPVLGAPILTASVQVGPGNVQLGLNRSRIESLDLRFEYREGEDRLRLLPSPLRFRDVETELAGVLEPADADGAIDPERFRFHLEPSLVRSRVGLPAGEKTPREAELRLHGRLDLPERVFALEQIEVLTEGGRLGGSAVYRGGDADDLTSLRLVARDLSAGSVKAFWPFLVSGRARHWVLDHVGDGGAVPHGSISMDVRRDRLGTAFRPGGQPSEREMRIDLALDDIETSTAGELPRLVRASGRLQQRGSTTQVLVDEAGVDGSPDVRIGPSTVTMGRVPDGEPRDMALGLDLHASGDLRQVLAIAARPPIRALRSVEIDPKAARGRIEGRAEAHLVLGRRIAPADQVRSWAVSGTLDGAALGMPIAGRTVTEIRGPVRLGPGLLEADVAAEVDGMPAKAKVVLPFGAAPAGERRIEVALDVGPAQIAAMAPALTKVVDGTVPATIVQDASGTTGRLDLTRARIDLPAVAWSKGSGVAANLTFRLEQADGRTTLRDVALGGDGFEARGEIQIDGQGLRSAVLRRLALNPGDDLKVEATRHSEGYGIEITGAQFDARPLIQNLRETMGAGDGESGGPTLDVTASIDRLNGFGGQSLQGFTLDYASDKGRVAALAASGQLSGRGVRADVSPREGARAVAIGSENVGALLRFSGLYTHMEGGRGALNLLGGPQSGYAGTLEVRDFALVDEPRLSRLVASAPTPGARTLSDAVGQDLRTERATFDQAAARLSFTNGTLRVADGIVRGPLFGSSFAGTLYDPRRSIDIAGSFMPAYGLNRVFGAIPVLGQILGNGNEGGLIGITYHLSGPFASPTLMVNPISVIAPGIFRQIFAY